MTDYYTQFSAKIHDITEEEKAWILAIGEPDFSELTAILGEEATKDLEDGGWLGFESDVSDEDWSLYAEDSADLENTTVVIQAFLRKFRPKDSLILYWANTCSKMHVEAFSGGSVLVTAHFRYFAPDVLERMQAIYDKSPDENVGALLVEAVQQLINEVSENSDG